MYECVQDIEEKWECGEVRGSVRWSRIKKGSEVVAKIEDGGCVDAVLDSSFVTFYMPRSFGL